MLLVVITEWLFYVFYIEHVLISSKEKKYFLADTMSKIGKDVLGNRRVLDGRWRRGWVRECLQVDCLLSSLRTYL